MSPGVETGGHFKLDQTIGRGKNKTKLKSPEKINKFSTYSCRQQPCGNDDFGESENISKTKDYFIIQNGDD